MNRKQVTIFIIGIIQWFLVNPLLFATHNRAGEIQVVQLSELSVRATIITYTKSSSTSADKDTLFISWGDGIITAIGRQNGRGEFLPNNVKKNIYTAEHNYPGRGTYDIGMMDPNRIDNIVNVDPPNSVNIPFYIQTRFTLMNLQFQGKNNSVRLLQPPIDFACLGQPFTHNPSAFDEDGDSLSFELIIPLMDKNTLVPNYSFPNQIQQGLNNIISFDSQKGTFHWTSPQKPGEYNIAFIVHEYRKGIRIASTIRDMQIFVLENCKLNTPPYLLSLRDTCIVAGNELSVEVIAMDNDVTGKGSKIKVEVFGAPFFIFPQAEFSTLSGFNKSPLRSHFTWKTDCQLVRKEPYTLTFKVTDDLFDTTGMSSLIVWQVTIVAPAPENLQSTLEKNAILLQWDKPYHCEFATNIFQGFSVWRKEGSLVLAHDTCHPGLEGKGYHQIAYLINDFQQNQYVYTDTLIEKGTFYCYRVQAEFAKLSASGIPFNYVASLHSNETCNAILLDRPILLNVDVQKTATQDGTIFVKWQRPSLAVFDTVVLTPPYTTKIWNNTNGIWNIAPNSTRMYSHFSNISDTEFVHRLINTVDFSHQYYVDIESNIGQNHNLSDTAMSVYLKLKPGDHKIFLQWDVDVPWTNFEYHIYRYNPILLRFDSIGLSLTTNYIDNQLTNDNQYCYKIKAIGSYGIQTIQNILINFSQELCAIPLDNEPPCCPELTVKSPCDSPSNIDTTEYHNVLTWNNPNENCANQDAIGYKIYSSDANHNFSLLTDIQNVLQLSYTHILGKEIPACYKITSYDIIGNECINTQEVCPIYCPIYSLPNTFTPNHDGYNDIFKPYPYRFVSRIEFQIFNRWGELVFKTSNPDILWDGNNLKGKKLENGSYFYNGIVFYSGIQTQKSQEAISGFIELLGQ